MYLKSRQRNNIIHIFHFSNSRWLLQKNNGNLAKWEESIEWDNEHFNACEKCSSIIYKKNEKKKNSEFANNFQNIIFLAIKIGGNVVSKIPKKLNEFSLRQEQLRKCEKFFVLKI